MCSKLIPLFLIIFIVSSNASQNDPRMELGFQARPKQYPFAAAIYHNSEYICSGTLISRKWVLTSGHCVDKVGDNDTLVVSLGGIKNIVQIETGRHDIPSLKHYSLHSNEPYIDNIGLLELAFEVAYTEYIRPIDLPKRGSIVEVAAAGTVLGFKNNTLHFGIMRTIYEHECIEAGIEANLIYDLAFCTDHLFATGVTCKEDLGTLFLVRTEDGSRTQVGILVFGGCSESPSIFIRTAMYLDWISEITGMYLP